MPQYVEVIHDTSFWGDVCNACLLLDAELTVLIASLEVRLCAECALDLADDLVAY